MDFVKLSKTLSYALRHAPWEFELELDEEGWVDVEQLLTELRGYSRAFAGVTREDLVQMSGAFDKKRFEIEDDRIRARYGHSVPQKVVKTPAKPPQLLYHGTAPKFVESILAQGLLPMGRHYVHLSTDTETAGKVGKRRSAAPTLLVILAEEAWADGEVFYNGGENIWLADRVPAKYIRVQ
ncbi:RNA 2'-phosphotransferase [Tumebacillus flagellatus]|uniref:Probable RNA 2'-phosphotransferase n=1 Tax=Tumebacillus flagellatus TaxID=1157490 RepID=A0A074LNU1_9BACL|nr:RNA 2'-phosphotransferase [Tumebacillus flagellatus]KEO82135.1 RNA 2'-phosphotransferase [Tumebacillus flagellatus]